MNLSLLMSRSKQELDDNYTKTSGLISRGCYPDLQPVMTSICWYFVFLHWKKTVFNTSLFGYILTVKLL